MKCYWKRPQTSPRPVDLDNSANRTWQWESAVKIIKILNAKVFPLWKYIVPFILLHTCMDMHNTHYVRICTTTQSENMVFVLETNRKHEKTTSDEWLIFVNNDPKRGQGFFATENVTTQLATKTVLWTTEQMGNSRIGNSMAIPYSFLWQTKNLKKFLSLFPTCPQWKQACPETSR